MAERRAAVVYDCLYPLQRGGGERVYRRIAEILVAHGLATDYVTRRTWGAEAPTAVFRPVGVWSGEIHDAAGVRRPRAALAFAWRCFRYFVRHRGDYDLVIASALPVLTVLAVRFAVLGAPTRVVADWLEIWPAAKWRAYSGALSGTVAAVLQWVAIRSVREHTVNSGFTAERLRAVRPRAHVRVLGLVDMADASDPLPAAQPPEILFVGRLIDDKRAELVPPVLERVRRSVPGARAVIVGEGPSRVAVEGARAAAGLEESIELLGRVDDDRLAAVRSRAAVLLAPSVREGFGLAVVESAAAGVPVVVVRHPDNAAADLVDPGVNGEIAPADDVDAIAEAVVRVILAGPALRASTLAWFRGARATRGVDAAIAAVLADGPTV